MGLKRPTANFTTLPNQIIDEIAPDLGNAELRVLLYLVRRIIGFDRTSDTVSLSQICTGIRGRDRGTSLKRTNAIRAIRKLEERGLVKAQRSKSPAGGHMVTLYTLIFDDEEVVPDRDQVVVPEEHHPGPGPGPGSSPAPGPTTKSRKQSKDNINRTPAETSGGENGLVRGDVVARLVELGMDPRTAAACAAHDVERSWHWTHAWRCMPKPPTNLGGLLRKAILNDWSYPTEYVRKLQKSAAREAQQQGPR